MWNHLLPACEQIKNWNSASARNFVFFAKCVFKIARFSSVPGPSHSLPPVPVSCPLFQGLFLTSSAIEYFHQSEWLLDVFSVRNFKNGTE